ncbi:MAG: hypothetical protein NWE85_02010, partial [Candidatus Bathyarchaeota archaeon]|nr:hypothetical protein [Candidatus Bathyarchaeota archaeon]
MRRIIKYCLMFSLPIVALLGILYFRQSLIVLFQQIGWLSIVQFLESNALANSLIIALILVEVLLFLSD